MTPSLPPLDMHAHVAASTTPRQLERLGAVVFAATRSLEEYERVATRKDLVTVWGVGVHPGVPAAIDNFDADRFRRLIEQTPFVSEIGLERRSKVDLGAQQTVLTSILDVLASTPRIASLHSSGAIGAVLEAIEAHPARGLVLHWWRGNAAQTRRAVELGCWFSINVAGLKCPADVALIPLDRLLTETDHPSGDRFSPTPRQPGSVTDLEASLATLFELPDDTALRARVWANFARLVDQVGVDALLPAPVQRMVAAARSDAS